MSLSVMGVRPPACGRINPEFFRSQRLPGISPVALKDAPRFPNHITTEKEIITAIAYGSRTLKKYGPDLLSGDITVLEDIALLRS